MAQVEAPLARTVGVISTCRLVLDPPPGLGLPIGVVVAIDPLGPWVLGNFLLRAIRRVLPCLPSQAKLWLYERQEERSP